MRMRALSKRVTLRAALSAAAVIAIAGAAGCAHRSGADTKARGDGYDFIVVGSGAGGGTLAARLARAHRRVLLLEAGKDVGDTSKYQVPAFHALSTEESDRAWWFFVHHNSDPAVDASDSKVTPQGVLYPRGSALGGSTAVNAMVTVLAPRSDWNRLAELTGEPGFRASAMDAYVDRVRGWLGVELANPRLAAGDRRVTGFLGAAAMTFAQAEGFSADEATRTAASVGTLLDRDVNEALRTGEANGVYRLPLATKSGHRNGPREWVLETVREGFPLTVKTSAFVTRVVWDERAAVPTAKGVEYVEADSVYGASLAQTQAPDARAIAEAGEVILSAGAFNTPELLQLSGVGDEETLRAQGIDPKVVLPGVGQNLQDRYEAAVVSELDAPLDVVASCNLGSDSDPCLDDWTKGRGVYQTPGFLGAVLTRSSADVTSADLQIFAAPTDARGYFPGYSQVSAKAKNRFTWLVLKAHTKNHDGTVRIVDPSPFARPEIHFHSYDEADPLADPDLRAVVAGVQFARRVADNFGKLVPDATAREVWPGREIASEVDLAKFVRKESWGHHACCTDKMGRADDPTAVVDTHFRVIGARNLRVVDASVFPEIPGTFIATAVFMLAERAADVIVEDAR